MAMRRKVLKKRYGVPWEVSSDSIVSTEVSILMFK